MQIHNKLVLLAVFFVVLFSLYSCSEDLSELDRQATSGSSDRPQVKEPIQNPKKRNISSNQKKHNCQKFSIKFLQANNEGKNDVQGSNNVIIFDPKSKCTFANKMSLFNPLRHSCYKPVKPFQRNAFRLYNSKIYEFACFAHSMSESRNLPINFGFLRFGFIANYVSHYLDILEE